ncbi:MAG TPA: hypothetical protein PLY17_04390, partial [Candidatus Hydrogenedentes bacterium]|nr:hypothetical protein [Candidatus Hydrogenedentota bacterium]
VPTTEVVGYSLSSLTGLNLYVARIPFSFVPTGLHLGAAFIPFSFVPAGLDLGALLMSGLSFWPLTFDTMHVVREMRALSSTQAASSTLTPAKSREQRLPPRPPRPPRPPEDGNGGEAPA